MSINERAYEPFQKSAKKTFKQFIFFKKNTPLYHGTTLNIKDNIMSNGLVGASSDDSISTFVGLSKQGVVYLTTSLFDAAIYSNMKSRHYWAEPKDTLKRDRPALDIFIPMVMSNNLDQSKIGHDDNTIARNEPELFKKLFEYHDSISPKKIKHAVQVTSDWFDEEWQNAIIGSGYDIFMSEDEKEKVRKKAIAIFNKKLLKQVKPI